MFTDDDLLPISALQHLVFCTRQCVLIHGEGLWGENRQTAEGRLLHERAHAAHTQMSDGRLIARGLRLASRRLGLVGIADVVEFLPAHEPGPGVSLPNRDGRWLPYPVEYKRGRPKAHDADSVQLCAQALCLEEMLGASIPAGSLFYGKTRRRQEVQFEIGMRGRVEQLTIRLRQLLSTGTTPPPEPGPKCKLCSLQSQCLPFRPASAQGYLDRTLRDLLQEATLS